MKAFIGLRMWVADWRGLDVERLDVVTWTITSSSLFVVEEELIGTVVDSALLAAVTVTHVQLTVELLAGWTWCVTNCCTTSSVPGHGVAQENACADMAATGDSISVVDPVCIVKSAVTAQPDSEDELMG